MRRWPRELNAPIAGVPAGTKVVDAWVSGRAIDGTLYGGKPRALPVSQVEIKVAGQVQTADVSNAETVKVFTLAVAAGPADIEATLLDKAGRALCSAYYVSVRKGLRNLATMPEQADRLAQFRTELDAWMKSNGDDGLPTENARRPKPQPVGKKKAAAGK